MWEARISGRLVSLADDVVRFVEGAEAMLELADHIVIGSQPNGRMKALSFALYGALKGEVALSQTPSVEEIVQYFLNRLKIQ